MKRLARKVSIAKWRGPDWASIDRMPADAVSSDLRTASNALSFWRADAEGKGEDGAILALLGTLQRVEKIDIAIIDGEALEEVALTPSSGDTSLAHLRDLHVDVEGLNHHSLIKTAVVLGTEIYASRAIQITKEQVRRRLQDEIDQGRLDWSELPEEMRKSLKQPSRAAGV